MSLVEDLRATVVRARDETDLLQIMLSGAVEKMDELIQLYATDLAETANTAANNYSQNINLARRNLQATISALAEAENNISDYLNYVG